ncbi:MAG: transcriptional regulator BetI [Pseudomonadota bacterium]
MSLARLEERPLSRAASKALRRQQLIDSTVETLAKRGFSETTLADVADGAGLSRGLVNFHFQSKDQLLVATLQYLADEYRDNWRAALAAAGANPVDRLVALVRADFDPKVCNKKKIAVWYAFWGEAKSRPTYLKLCADRDQEYEAVLKATCQALIDEGPYPALDADLVASGITALTDGLWLDFLIDPARAKRSKGLATTYLFLAGLFPLHLATDGRVLG